ncbi:phosphoribosylformylglycinamidine cyclo-ligase [Lederbergia sp. NSJ-179]|uniref:phosphoribosylformylglycinamidine cyclo-ligase n=1 Tax=Lederbergia sp. NSJ-179 TaxID=2931402 RepID=UPI001FD1107E|nr:phosphoribosylformylglycinamidine cyclo-ligase [Lederbergia sp. NSJ-179]MCJ7840996.1 phosphoribosylformylglycinamidine cyclo-ligase [Lederbergia sp. NSJ-179]
MTGSYQQAGVDVEKGYEAVKRMKKHIAKTNRPEAIGEIGGFGGLFDLTAFKYEEPVLVSGTDGVGTKLKLAFQMNIHHSVGIDLVAMCVNDIVAQGASPLFFLDYIACGKNNPDVIEQIVKGVAEGCVQAGAALIGGETAEMPGMYEDHEYDLAGFAVGIAEKSKLITGKAIDANHVLIGFPSSGIHSNGYSLVRKIVDGLDLHKTYDGLTETLGEALLVPTKIYTKQIQSIQQKYEISGIAHITGGGFYENFPRMLPAGLGVELEPSSWQVPAIFSFLQKEGNIPTDEMYGVFNMGIGMAIAVSREDANGILDILHQQGEYASIIGRVVEGEGVHFKR